MGQSAIWLRCQALSLIPTCQQAHEEGTNVLYGQNTFSFGDAPYFEYSFGEDESYDSPFTPSGVYLPFCEVTYMYGFLSVIGKANQSKIRHVKLVFDTEMFLTLPGQRSVWTYVAQDKMGGAGCFGDALDFLSENHRLQSLNLSFEGYYGCVAGFSLCFAKESRIARKLVQFEAIEKFDCNVWDDVGRCDNNDQIALYEEAVHDYQGLKLKLEAAHQKESGQHDSCPTKRRFQSDPVSQHEASSV